MVFEINNYVITVDKTKCVSVLWKESSNPEQKEMENRIEMGESSRRDIWKRNRRSTCEGGNAKLLRNIQQDTEKRYKKGDPGRKYKKMAESMGGTNKRSYY